MRFCEKHARDTAPVALRFHLKLQTKLRTYIRSVPENPLRCGENVPECLEDGKNFVRRCRVDRGRVVLEDERLNRVIVGNNHEALHARQLPESLFPEKRTLARGAPTRLVVSCKRPRAETNVPWSSAMKCTSVHIQICKYAIIGTAHRNGATHACLVARVCPSTPW